MVKNKENTSNKDNEKIDKSRLNLFSQLLNAINLEVIIGSFFLLFGIMILFNKLLNIYITIGGMLSVVFFITGIYFHINYFNQKNNITFLLAGHLFLLFSLNLSSQLFCCVAENIFVTFILLQIFAVSILAYLLQSKVKWLLYIAVASFILILLNLLSEKFAVNFRDAAVLWVIAFFFLIIYQSHNKWFYLGLSLLFFAIGLIDTSAVNGEIISVFILWTLAAPLIYLFIKKPAHWWAFLIAGILFLASINIINDSIVHILPQGSIAILWLAGFSFLFFSIGILPSKKSRRWANIIGTIFLVFTLVVFIAEFNKEEFIFPLVFIFIGLGLIIRRITWNKKIFKIFHSSSPVPSPKKNDAEQNLPQK
jgi:hypothetical protein